ncbi:phosphohistidine phosphatase SixA [Aphanothece hegewaldii CCALA 016]|uniref:Phosphohistidine phosphatase SixA n=1 Tax=Aphanothece hegewaldii CCALA 016 TaxID=2107694 RepID=A0A2T1M2I9_9CHRO|nr:phosphohistidine phosphatase SixA [Aphanothece hegewaldii]PSF38952.1 phosphohistidine phosphatase SixA [Aphanothece hegewaldii CCALA 016]
MKLYIIRHGIAAEKTEYKNDEERPLIEKGRQKTEQVAQCLKDIGIHFDLILTSPLVRAKQTAEILQKNGLSDQLENFSALAPDGDIQEWVNWWLESRYNLDKSCLALVGHEPDLGHWTEILIWGQPQDKLILKKSGVIGLELPVGINPISKSHLFLLTSPKWLINEKLE